MLVVLTCFASCEPFGLLTKRIPVAMLPVLGKPLIEYHLEQLSNAGLTEVYVTLVEHPKYIRKFLGTGERWGLNLVTIDFKEPCKPEFIFKKIKITDQKRALILPAETLISLDFELLHEKVRKNETGSMYISGRCANSQENNLREQTGSHHFEDYCDTNVQVLPLTQLADTRLEVRQNTEWMKVSSAQDLASANRLAVSGHFPWALDRVTKDSNGNLFGHHSSRARDTEIDPPVFIGSYAKIGKNVKIRNHSVIGNGAVISDDVIIDGSVIFDNTFIGSHSDVINKIVSGRTLFNPVTGLGIEITDPVIIAGVHERHLRPKLKRVMESFLSLVLLIITMPLWLGKIFMRRIAGKSSFDEVTYMSSNEFADDKMGSPSKSFTLLTFKEGSPLTARLPALMDVMKGKLSLVGVRPLTHEAMDHFWEDWEMLRFEAPIGLFTIIDSENAGALEEEEKLVMENYYAATRSFKTDLKILFKALGNLIGSKQIN